MKNTQQYCNQ